MSSRFDLRVTRGGSWYLGGATYLAVRARLGNAPSDRDDDLGFRCARAKSTGSGRVIRGGSWYGGAASCRAADRFRDGPGYRYSNLGFRLVRREE